MICERNFPEIRYKGLQPTQNQIQPSLNSPRTWRYLFFRLYHSHNNISNASFMRFFQRHRSRKLNKKFEQFQWSIRNYNSQISSPLAWVLVLGKSTQYLVRIGQEQKEKRVGCKLRKTITDLSWLIDILFRSLSNNEYSPKSPTAAIQSISHIFSPHFFQITFRSNPLRLYVYL